MYNPTLPHFCHIYGHVAGEAFAKLNTIDEEAINSTYIYELLGDASNLFSIKNGTLVANKTFNFEKDSIIPWTIQLKSTDDGDPPLGVSQFYVT